MEGLVCLAYKDRVPSWQSEGGEGPVTPSRPQQHKAASEQLGVLLGEPPLLEEPAVEMAWPLTALKGGWGVRKETPQETGKDHLL